jgi:hypothetical protein
VDFKPRKTDDGKATLDLEYNVILAPKDVEGASNVPMAPGGAPVENGVNGTQ